MASNSRLKKIARAFAEEDPKLHDLAQAALHDIDLAKAELTTEAQAIRQLIALAPRPRTNIDARATNGENGAEAERVTIVDSGPGLSEGVKLRIATIWREEKTKSKADLSASQVLSRLTEEGVLLNVGNPPMAVGTVLARVRREYEANGQMEGI